MKKHEDFDVVVVGGGANGLLQTILLAQQGIKTACIEPNPLPHDERTTAISYGSMRVMEQAGVWERLDCHACPIQEIKILDGRSPVLIDFDANDIAKKTDNHAFGWIIDNTVLRQGLLDQLEKEENGHLIAGSFVLTYNKNDAHVAITLDNQDTLTASLVIGADGRRSFTRDYMGVGEHQWDYNQTAIVCMVRHENPHHHVAIEHFLKSGPFALLPAFDTKNGQHQSALVWTKETHELKKFQAMSDEVFMIALNEIMPPDYGAVQSISCRYYYPLNLIHANAYIAERFALIGDAAHGIHPIAGQGLNLGIRDIHVMTDILSKAYQAKEDLGSVEILSRYEKSRHMDNSLMITATDTLNKLFSNPSKLLSGARKIGMSVINKTPFAKEFFMTQAAGIDKY